MEIEALLPGPSEAPPAIFEVFIDGRNVFSQEVSRGVWIVLGFQLTSLPTTEPFATELHVRGTEEQFRENLIWVRKLELGTS